MPGLNLSVIIITLNEEKRLEQCLASLPKGCEIVIVDSASSDGTAGIATRFGARFYIHPFQNYAAQKNTALQYAQRDWVLSIDADEVVSPELCSALEKAVVQDEREVAFFLKRHLRFLGRTLNYGRSTDRVLRLFRKEDGCFVGSVHEKVTLSPPNIKAKILPGHIIHSSYENFEDYFEKFNRYTTLIAEKKSSEQKSPPALWKICLRPFYEFTVRYFFRLGFLDGYPGYCYALISSMYAFIKLAKHRALNS